MSVRIKVVAASFQPLFGCLVSLRFNVVKLGEQALARLFNVEEVAVDQRLPKRPPHLEQHIITHAVVAFLAFDVLPEMAIIFV